MKKKIFCLNEAEQKLIDLYRKGGQCDIYLHRATKIQGADFCSVLQPQDDFEIYHLDDETISFKTSFENIEAVAFLKEEENV